ncbi:MAG TPA: flagellar biosynthesis protein FlgA [Micromonosporaceae bacterium]|nr:flagellar biosynthesis protein FlgA [Micromonosporaceae bacterium]
MNRRGLDPEPKLYPARRWSLPAGRTLLRAVVVAALLGLAAAMLYLDPPTGAPPACPAAPATPTPVGRLAVPAGLVGLPVALAEPAAAAVVRPGDRVDLMARPGTGQVIAEGALVLEAIGADPAPALYLALDELQAKAMLRAGSAVRFDVIVRPQ